MTGAPVKVLYLIDFLAGPVAGTERQLLDLIEGLDRSDCQPLLAVFRETPFVSNTNSLPVPVRVLEIDRLLSIRAWLRLFKLAWMIRRERIDLVHIFFNDAALAAPLFCWLGGAKVVVARRDLGFWYSRAKLAVLRFSNRFVDAIVANSEAVRRSVTEREGYPFERIKVIYNGHEPQRFAQKPAVGFRERYGIPASSPIVGIVANLNPVKRHRDLIDAFERVRTRFENAHLVLIGAGPLETTLRSRAKVRGVENAVHFLGSMKEVIPVVRLLSVAVLCSESEGFSNALIEYLGCGVPVVATRVGGNTELIEDGVNGFLVDVADIGMLASRIETLLADPGRACDMGARGRNAAEALTLERMVKAHVRVYRAVNEGRPVVVA